MKKPSPEKHILSKSTFLTGLQCPKALYLNKYHKELATPVSDSLQKIFNTGHSVGDLAKSMFPGGVDFSFHDYNEFLETPLKTYEAIESGKEVIYEAAFKEDGIYAAADIIVKDAGKNSWKVYEVKSSTSVSDVYVWDAAVQLFVYTSAGLEISDISIVHINNRFIKDGPINPEKFFQIESVFDMASAIQNDVRKTADYLKGILDLKKVPEIEIGEHCLAPYECPFKAHCWKHIPEHSVFNISRLTTSRRFEMLASGVVDIDDVNPVEWGLTENQSLEVEAYKNNTSFINSNEILNFLSSFEFPLGFLDFETFNPAIPLFDGTRPYQQIPFQYSFHVISDQNNNDDVTHHEFLGEPGYDPRRKFIERLLEETKPCRTILVYNASFEKTVLKDLASLFPEYTGQIHSLIEKIDDLGIPFARKWYYTPEMKGSWSIKVIYPSLIETSGYKDLEIADGGSAMMAYEALQSITDKEESEKIKRNLLAYCKMDTWAMVEIYRKLKELVSPS